MPGDVRIHPRLVEVQHVRDRVRDSLISLVRYEQINVFRLQARAAEHLTRNLSHRAHGDLEHFVSFHLKEVVSSGNGLGSETALGSPTGRVQLLFVTTIRPNLTCQNAPAFFYR